MARFYPDDVFRLGDCLNPAEKLVAIALASYGEKIHPSQAHLAIKTGYHPDTVSRIIVTLRKKGIVETFGCGKSLTYKLNLRSYAGGTSDRPSVDLRSSVGAPPIVDRRDPNTVLNPVPNQRAADAAAGGWEVPEDVQGRIRIRDPRADMDAQRRVCAKVMIQHGLTEEEAKRAWRDLCLGWARTGNNAYDLLNREVHQLGGARDVRAVLLHRLKGVAA